MDWTPTRIATYLDNTLLGEYHDCAAIAGMNDKLYILMTATVIHRVPPNPSNSFPQKMEIDYVRVWQWEIEDMD